MKKKDIGPLILVAVVSAILSVFISGAIFSPSKSKQSVEVVEELSTDFNRPSTVYFNGQAINPAQNIQVGQDVDSKPFGN